MMFNFTLTPIIHLSKLLWVLIAMLMFGSLSACTPTTDDERVASLNKRLAPEGHFTNTHFIVRWPAIKGKKHVNAKPLKLKIPLEYLPYKPYLNEPKAHPVLRRDVSLGTYHLYKGLIKTVGLNVTYDAKPLVLRPTKQYKNDAELEAVRQDKQKMGEILKQNINWFSIRIFRHADDYDYGQALKSKKTGANDGFYVDYFGNTTHKKREFQVYWDLHGHKVVLYGSLAPAQYVPEEKSLPSDQSIFPIDKTNPYYQYTELDDWRDIALPARELLESFVVED